MKAYIVASLIGVGCMANAAELHVTNTVDLNDQRVRERIAAEKPAQFATIERILREAGDQPPEQLTRWMKTSFDAQNARYTNLLKTSDPPKAELWFVLGDTRYHAQVTLRSVHPKLISGELHPKSGLSQ